MGYDLEELRREFNEDQENNAGKGGKFGDLPWYSLPDDTTETKLRFLPSPKGDGNDMVGKVIHKHYSIPEQKSLTCGKTWGIKCPICEMLDKFRGRLDLKTWDSVAMSIFNVLVLNDKQIDPKTPQILSVYGDFTYRWIRDFLFNDEVGDITDVRTGSSVLFQREKFKGKFKRTVSRNATSIGDDKEIAEIMKKRTELNNIWKAPDEKYLGMLATGARAVEKEILKKLNEPAPTTESTKEDDSFEYGANVEGATESKPAVEQPKVVSKPVDAKECFGKYRGDKECDFCTYDFECKKNS